MQRIGSIPFDVKYDQIALLFVTSQTRGRWILPKGLPKEGESHAETCAREGFEEAGIKGVVMDDQRLKDPGGWDYFDELLERIREIRASEKRFYQKVRDLFALSSDYGIDERATHVFFAEVQNKLHFAATGHTAAELIVDRADPNEPNMALTN